MVGRSLTRRTGDTRYPRWGAHSPVLPGTPGTHSGAGYSVDAAALWPPVGRWDVGARGAGQGSPVHQPPPTDRRTQPCLDRLAGLDPAPTPALVFPDSDRGPLRLHRLDKRTLTPRSPVHGRPQETPLQGPSRRAGQGPTRFPTHSLSSRERVGVRAPRPRPYRRTGDTRYPRWGAHSPVLPGTPGTHGGAGYSADTAALWPPIGASLVGARGRVGQGSPVHQPRPNRQAHRPFHDRHATPRSGAHTRTRLPRLRSGTPSATARLNVWAFHPRSHHHGYRVSPVRRGKASSCRT